jgi:Spermine/spermidine synthase domain
LLSFLLLFVELALIRWTGSDIVYLSYFSNFVLLGSFLGIGLGFLGARSRAHLFRWAPVALALLVAFVRASPVEIDRSGSELIYFGAFTRSGLPTWVTLPAVFVAVATVMALLAHGVARVFQRFPPLEAYRLDVVGGLGGIAAFSLLAFAGAPPVAWGVVVAIAFAVLEGRRLALLQAVAVGALVVMLGLESVASQSSWSPYYKITLEPRPSGIDILVNGIPHQAIESTGVRRSLEPIYFLPYERRSTRPLGDVLIIGAGNGTDVAIALEQGARSVDAVEIDPELYQLGVELHPDHPYSDPRVQAHIEDGRAFLERTGKSYDLILFALPDSLTLVAGQSSLRLESYLFTREAMEEARAHLEPNGVFGMYNYYREEWLLDRLAGTLEQAFGRPPCIDSVGVVGRLALLTEGSSAEALRCPQSEPQAGSAAPAPATDDYPFLYLKERSIPGFYLLTLGFVLVVSVVATRAVAGPVRRIGPYLDLFFMGAAFLLLETKSVVQFALLFGTTWFVNALVFAGILVSVLGAIELSRRVSMRTPAWLYAALLLALVVAWTVPQESLLSLVLPVRFIAATAVAFSPIFVANLIFAERFKKTSASAMAFGANLLGAMLGGVLEYASLVTGYRALLVVVAVLYFLAFATGGRVSERTGERLLVST